MDKSWLQKWFGSPLPPGPESMKFRADQGDADAQFGLGLQFANGEGDALDYAQAASWYLKAAQQNHSLAQFNLGLMFADGQGVAQDDLQSVMWMEKAACLGDAGAQHNLGTRQQRAGFAGVTKNSVETRLEAYKWFGLSAAQGYKGSDAALEHLTLTMSREEVAEGRHRLAEFTLAHPAPLQLTS